MHLLLVRHGQTDENARGILQGQSQTALNATGHAQARQLADRLRTYIPRAEALVSSDLVRARQTAEILSAVLGIGVEQRQVWRERGFGPFEGRAIGEADIWRAANGHWDLPGAESTVAFQTRVLAAMGETVRDYASLSCLAVVTHGAVLRNVLNLLGDGRLRLVEGHRAPASVPIVNCAIMHLEAQWPDVGEIAWRVHAVNDTGHLEEAATFRVEE